MKSYFLLCVLCFEHSCETGKGPGPPGKGVTVPLTLRAGLSTLAEPAPLRPCAPWGCFMGSKAGNAVSHLPLLLINEFLKYLSRPSHHHKCCFKEGQMVEVNEQQMERKWYHMTDLTSSVRRGAKNRSPSFPTHGRVTRTTATATNGCSNFLFIQVTTLDLPRLKTYTCFL